MDDYLDELVRKSRQQLDDKADQVAREAKQNSVKTIWRPSQKQLNKPELPKKLLYLSPKPSK